MNLTITFSKNTMDIQAKDVVPKDILVFLSIWFKNCSLPTRKSFNKILTLLSDCQMFDIKDNIITPYLYSQLSKVAPGTGTVQIKDNENGIPQIKIYDSNSLTQLHLVFAMALLTSKVAKVMQISPLKIYTILENTVKEASYENQEKSM